MRFIDAFSPLPASGKLGGFLLQYPRWFLPTPESKAVLAEAAERLSGILPPSSFAMPRGSTRHDTQLERSTCCVTWD